MLLPYFLTVDTHPLRDPKLAAQIEQLERTEHAGDPKILEQTVSDRTTAANAYAVGIGPTERVVFWDTLLDGRFSDREVRFVAAHELGHIARNHLVKGVAWFGLFIVPILGLVAWVTERRGGLRDPGNVPLALLVIVALQLLSLPLQNAVSRRYEAEADWTALVATHDPVRRAVCSAASQGRASRTRRRRGGPRVPRHAPNRARRIEQAAAWRQRNGVVVVVRGRCFGRFRIPSCVDHFE